MRCEAGEVTATSHATGHPTRSGPAARGHSETGIGLDARRRRIRRNRTLTDDLNVGGAGKYGWNRRLNGAGRLSDESGQTDQRREDRRS